MIMGTNGKIINKYLKIGNNLYLINIIENE